MNPITDDILMHYGVKRRSGRYPWGSGESPYQHSGDFLSRFEELRKSGMSETDIAKTLNMTTTDLRVFKRIATHERKQLEVARAKSLREDGLGYTEIGRIMGKPESSIRSMLEENREVNISRARKAADVLAEELSRKKMLDVGIGVEKELGISANTLQEAITILELEGYNVYGIGIPNVTNVGKQINTKVLCEKDINYSDVYNNMGDIQSVRDYHSIDGGSSYTKIQYPASIDSDRIYIRYGDQGGSNKDGVIEIRRGVDDLDLGNSHYAQVRILVDDTHYLKGMAIYSDDLPEGYDIVFNTNKKTGTDKMKVLKEIKDDPDNPFGATIKANGQSTYFDKDGNEHLSAINKIKEEGEWDTSSSKNLSSQFLSKQPMSLIKKQLDLTYADAEAEYDEICSITNPTLKRKMLNDFADNCDAATVHLKAAALPRQRTQVILPVDDLGEDEIYAPNYRNGEQVALVRYPHGGTFEIPVLTVNNKNKKARATLGEDVQDAVGINSKVAERLSGADFDGDTVVVIPTNDKVRIKSTPRLKDLKDFDAKTEYSTEGKTGVRLMKKGEKQREMGTVSNLITDMTLRGATDEELAKAVKHSMVVIDAEKHQLDYKQSEIDNDIPTLKQKYQVRVDDEGNVKTGGASTLISRRKQEVEVPERKGSARVDKDTGEVIYKESGRTYVDKKTGQVKAATTKVPIMSTVDDAYELSSGTSQENEYAKYANKMKALSREARKESANTGKIAVSKAAKETYKEEVDSLDAKLNIALKNAPKERRAQAIANSTVKAKVQSNPDMDKKEIKKAKQIAINNARASVGATGKGSKIEITDKEWEACQAGAISDTKFSQILRFADQDKLRERATPKAKGQLSTAKVNKIKSMRASGYTNAEIADAIGVSVSTVNKYS